MTKAHSELGDNGGRCESCDLPETIHQSQSTIPVFLGGGLGCGTMWVCPKCLAKHRQKERLAEAKKHLTDALDNVMLVVGAKSDNSRKMWAQEAEEAVAIAHKKLTEYLNEYVTEE
jgi:hypothetical protein